MLILGVLSVFLSLFLFVCPTEFKTGTEVTLGHEELESESEEDEGEGEGEGQGEEGEAIPTVDMEKDGFQRSSSEKKKSQRSGPKQAMLKFRAPNCLRCVSPNAWNAVMVCLTEPTFLLNTLAICS